MKLLLSAYACEPNRGSEAGIGWHWVMQVAELQHDVWVLTRSNNREAIRRELPHHSHLRFVYFDLPDCLARLKKKGPFLQIYYAMWQWGAYHEALKLHRRERFDLVQHLTFGTFRHVSFMGRLGIPFVFGPVGGGERVPLRLRMDYGIRGHLLDAVRDVANIVAKWNPWLHETLSTASLILVKTPHTGLAMPALYQHKIKHLIEIGAPEFTGAPPLARRDGQFKLLFIGRFLFWKGMQYGLRAFATLLRECPNVRLTMVGAGPEEHRWRRLCKSLKIDHAVVWNRWMRHDELWALYRSHDVFLFPSLHDSSGSVVLEAMSYGLPVVCFDLGGPGVLVNERCGMVVSTANRTCHQLVTDLAERLRILADRPERLQELRAGALDRARALTWATAVRHLYGKGGFWELPRQCRLGSVEPSQQMKCPT